MRRVAVVTTCNAEGYELYGRRMIESFDRHFPADINLLVYAEGFAPELPSDRVIPVDLLEACPDLVAFKARHHENPRARGKEPRGRRPWVRVKWHKNGSRLPRVKLKWVDWGIGYRWDAVHGHKCFAIFDAATRCGTDVLCWMDAKISQLFEDTPRAFIEGLVPADCLLGFLKRPGCSECGLVAYNLRHPGINEFFAAFKSLYTHDSLFREREYHDSWLFDVVRRRFEKRRHKTHDIAGGLGVRAGHVFINSPLGRYMDHMKGGRWAAGSSSAEDLIVARPEAYWELVNGRP
ncbi:MAG: hypothetical protein U1E33_04135 [Rhodospirillales bacterium]